MRALQSTWTSFISLFFKTFGQITGLIFSSSSRLVRGMWGFVLNVGGVLFNLRKGGVEPTIRTSDDIFFLETCESRFFGEKNQRIFSENE